MPSMTIRNLFGLGFLFKYKKGVFVSIGQTEQFQGPDLNLNPMRMNGWLKQDRMPSLMGLEKSTEVEANPQHRR